MNNRKNAILLVEGVIEQDLSIQFFSLKGGDLAEAIADPEYWLRDFTQAGEILGADPENVLYAKYPPHGTGILWDFTFEQKQKTPCGKMLDDKDSFMTLIRERPIVTVKHYQDCPVFVKSEDKDFWVALLPEIAKGLKAE